MTTSARPPAAPSRPPRWRSSRPSPRPTSPPAPPSAAGSARATRCTRPPTFGWHDTNGAAGAELTITWGNNVRAYQDRNDDNTGVASDSPDGGAGLNFDFPLDLTQGPSTYTAAAVTNLFYWNNIIHDVMYQYGFDEASGNFQVNNYGNGGLGNDDVRAEAQDGADTGKANNANFGTPSDGSQPRMQMYEWTTATPRLDGDFDAGIIIHEYAHGISNRLTGGPSNVSCLGNSEQMGEGWSDWIGLMLTQQSTHTGPLRRGIGTYALNEATTGPGIRPAPYSTDFAENDFTYQDSRTQVVPHGVGFVWSTILWEVTWELINEYGYDADIYDADGTAGNQIALNLVTEGMKLQPCSPGFVDGRDAIIAADAALYPDAGNPGRGLHYDDLWAAFARRGLGASADQGSTSSNADNTEAFDTPVTPGIVEISPNSLAFTVPSGGSDAADVTITNTGAPSDGTISFDAFVSNQSQPPTAPLLGTGGPDTFGYVWSDSDEPGGPAVDFQDISGTGTALSFSSSDDGTATVALPFSFPFYGTTYDEVSVSTNGYAAFQYAQDFSNNPIPDAAFPNGVLAPYWDDLHTRSGTAYSGTLGDGRFVIQWTNWGRYEPSSGQDLTFQILLSPDGTVEYQYETMTTTVATSHTTGIENASGTDGLQVFYNEAGAVSDYAVRFTQPLLWATASPSSGTVAPGTSEGVTVTVDATDLPDGVYTANLVIMTNDPDALSTSVPITMTVSDGGSISIVVDGPRGWRYFGPPAAGVTVDDLAAQNLVRGVPGYYENNTNPTLLTSYSTATNSWSMEAGAGDVLPLGHAFKWFMTGIDGIGNPSVSQSQAMPFTLSTDLTANTADVRVELATSGNRMNHLANPFGTTLYLDGASSWPGGFAVATGLFVYDASTAAWVSAPSSIEPWETFRFRSRGPRRNGGPRLLDIPFSATVPPATRTLEPTPALAFRLDARAADGRALADRMMTVAFDDAASAAFDMDEDQEKFQPPAEAYALIGARAGTEFLGHDARPFAAAEIPLAIEAVGTRAEMTLSWDADALPAGLPVVLVDLATGDVVDVRTRDSYSFRAATRQAHDAAPLNDLADGGQATDRFVLRIGEAMAAAADVTELALDAPAPNPSAGTARIGFAMPEAGAARVAVYDVRGRQVAVLADGEVAAGRHEATLDGGALAAGVYVVRLEALGQVIVRQAVVVR